MVKWWKHLSWNIGENLLQWTHKSYQVIVVQSEMCRVSLLSSTANYQCQGVQRVALWPYHSVVGVQGQNTEEPIFHSPEIKIRASSHLFLHLPDGGKASLPSPCCSHACSQLSTPVQGEEPLCRCVQLPGTGGSLLVWSHWVSSHTSQQCACTGTCSPASCSSWWCAGCCPPWSRRTGCSPARCERRTAANTEHITIFSSSNFHFLLHFSSWAQTYCRWPILVWNDRINKLCCSATCEAHSMRLYSTEHGKITTFYRPNPTVRTHSWGPAPITWHRIIALLQWPALGTGSPKDSRKGTSTSNHFIFISAVWAILRNAHYFPSVSCSLV